MVNNCIKGSETI